VIACLTLFACGGETHENYEMEQIVPGAPFHGIHGLTFDNEGRLLVGSVVGQSIYEVNPETGDISVFRGPSDGQADDIEQGPDGTLAWTAFLEGKIYAQTPDGAVKTLAEGYPGFNSLAFASDGRLFATQVFAGDALYEIDLSGENEPRLIMKDMGGLNGFDFGPDGKLYGPIWFKGQVARVDVDTAELEVVAEGFGIPAAANFNSKGELFVVDTKRGEVVKVSTETGTRTVLAKVKPSIDNLAFDAQDNLFITNMADNAILQINLEDGSHRELVSFPLAVAGDIEWAQEETGEVLYVADLFAFRKIDLRTNKIEELARIFAGDTEYTMNVSINDGRIATTAWSAGTVELFEAGGRRSLGLHHGFEAPHDAIALEDGSVYVLSLAAGTLSHISGEDFSERKVVVEGLEGPTSLVQDAAGMLIVTETAGGKISSIDPSTWTKLTLVENLNQPEGLAAAPDGTLVIAEVGKKRIVRLDRANGEISVIADELPIGFKAPPGAPASFIPTGVAVSDTGDIYFSSDVETAIYRLKKPPVS